MAASIAPTTYSLGFADWCRLPEDGNRYEILGGELFLNPAPNVKHQRISRNLEWELINYLEEQGRGEVFNAPLGVCLSDNDIPQPDLIVVLEANAYRIGEQVVDGAPDLVVEILSASSARHDLDTKRRVYAEHHIPEYWIIEPAKEFVQVFVLRGCAYEVGGSFERADRLTSALLPGFAPELRRIFPTTT